MKLKIALMALALAGTAQAAPATKTQFNLMCEDFIFRIDLNNQLWCEEDPTGCYALPIISATPAQIVLRDKAMNGNRGVYRSRWVLDRIRGELVADVTRNGLLDAPTEHFACKPTGTFTPIGQPLF